jgi:hypothetical protein
MNARNCTASHPCAIASAMSQPSLTSPGLGMRHSVTVQPSSSSAWPMPSIAAMPGWRSSGHSGLLSGSTPASRSAADRRWRFASQSGHRTTSQPVSHVQAALFHALLPPGHVTKSSWSPSSA